MKESKIAKGRIGVYLPNHPKANNRGYILRSRYVVEQYLGRFLDSDEHVHHCNENKLDDSLENLDIIFHREHMEYHNNLKQERELDYSKIAELRRKNGWGYKKISKTLGYNVNSVKSAVRIIDQEGLK